MKLGTRPDTFYSEQATRRLGPRLLGRADDSGVNNRGIDDVVVRMIWSVLSLGIIDVEHSDGALARRTEKEPTGGQGVEDPLGIDQCVQPSGDVAAGCEEKERSIGQEFGKLDTKGAACVRVSKESMASSSAEEQSMNLAQGQKETGIKCPNGSQHFFIIEDPRAT
ncbi:hypothetical protein JHK87_043794 [Glycine soja]|nr:hypothetical protein JHK87_043794 [Glycine soja]